LAAGYIIFYVRYKLTADTTHESENFVFKKISMTKLPYPYSHIYHQLCVPSIDFED